MEGEFLRKKYNIRIFLLFGCGLFFIGLYIFRITVEPDTASGVLSFMIFGIIMCIYAISSWLLNYGAFIHINENSIKAKYHWFGKINCNLSDVIFAVAKNNTLIIQLKNGKTHTITGIANPAPLVSEIRRHMSFEINDQPQKLIEKLNIIKNTRKNEIIYVCFGILLMFINIFVTVFLTDERELYEFSRNDWITFTVMSTIEIITVFVTFCFAHKAGKKNILIEKMQYIIRRRIIETKAILPGNVIKVFSDDNYWGRITVFGYPDNDSVYYSVQEFSSDYDLIQAYESEIFEDIEQLYDDFDYLIDITKEFYAKKE